MNVHMEMSEDQRSVLGKVEKLLRLAGSNPNKDEAASAAAKAQELLLAYNLDAALIGASEDGRRMQEKLVGGFYTYERDLWYAVATLNFCLHWTDRVLVERPEKDRLRRKVQERYSEYAQMYRKQTRQHLVGRRLAVETTKFTMDYLSEAIERLTREYIGAGLPRSAEGEVVGLGASLRSRRAVSFRSGIAASVVNRLWEKRNEAEAKERSEKAAAERRARESGVSSSTAVTISSVRQAERDANMDHLYGEGWSAKQREDTVRRAAARKAAEEEYTKWAAAHPEDAKKQAAEKKKEEERQRKRWSRSTGKGSRGGRTGPDHDWGAYYAGEDAGRTLGLDPQAEHAAAPRKIGRSV